MIENLGGLKIFLRNLEKEGVIFKKHFYEKIEDRPYLTEGLIFDSLKNIENILGFQKQIVGNKERFRIGIKLSSKYNLVIVCEIEGKNLYIVTVWKTSRKWQKAIQK